ncbi:DUF2946 family protein [Acinetobacter sp. A3.8]|uniref:DUF2946 family protein n=1 Tax=Acinetobacter sedimenti TaxID=2919922 RepID=A0A9X1WZ31_9GAMM|nr:DUF2946 family protein [Acinetobacter sedimenti]MCJ8146682.1 DUF2946 family protein [Acinetobacter sedimenti]
MFYSGLLLSCFAVCLQIAVFLQPLLPAQYQISPVCETISRALLLHDHYANSNAPKHLDHHSNSHQVHTIDQNKNSTHDAHSMSLHDDQHRMQMADTTQATSQLSNHQHDAGHQCQYCTVYANLVLPSEFGIQEVFERVQVRLLFLQRQFAPIYFYLQRLFLIPQGRAPPLFA